MLCPAALVRVGAKVPSRAQAPRATGRMRRATAIEARSHIAADSDGQHEIRARRSIGQPREQR